MILMSVKETTILQEGELGKFQTLVENIQEWVKENNDSVRVTKSVYTIGADKEKRYYPRAVKIIYESTGGTVPPIEEEPEEEEDE